MEKVGLLRAVHYTFENNRQEVGSTPIRWQLASTIDYLFSVSWSTSRKAVFQKNRFVIYRDSESYHISGILRLIKCVAFSILFFYTNWKNAALFTVAGLTIKWGIRRKAALEKVDSPDVAEAKRYLNNNFPSRQTGQFANFKTHLIRLQNQCDFMLALLGKGFEELGDIERGLSSVGSDLIQNNSGHGSEEMMKVTIEGNTKNYPVSFLKKIDFFRFLDFWRAEDGKAITLGASIPVTHEGLQTIQNSLSRGFSWWTPHLVQQMDFLGFLHKSSLMEQQSVRSFQEILSKDDASLGEWLNCHPEFKHLNKESAQAKVPQFSSDIFPIPNCPEMDQQVVITYLTEVSNGKYSKEQKHYLFNGVLDKYLYSLDEKKRVDVLKVLIEQVFSIREFITLLRLSFKEGDQAEVCTLLAQLPHLRWLELAALGFDKPWGLSKHFPKLQGLRTLSLQVRPICSVEAYAIALKCPYLVTFDREIL